MPAEKESPLSLCCYSFDEVIKLFFNETQRLTTSYYYTNFYKQPVISKCSLCVYLRFEGTTLNQFLLVNLIYISDNNLLSKMVVFLKLFTFEIGCDT